MTPDRSSSVKGTRQRGGWELWAMVRAWDKERVCRTRSSSSVDGTHHTTSDKQVEQLVAAFA